MEISRRTLIAAVAASTLPSPLLAAVPRPQLVAATNLRMPRGFMALKPDRLGFTFRTLHIVGAPATELVLGFCGWAVPSNLEIDLQTPYDLARVAIEFGSQTVPVTFGGGRSVTVAGGRPYILSDPVPAAAFGLTAFNRDTRFFVRAAGSARSTVKALPIGTPALDFDMLMCTYAAGTAADDVDGNGPIGLPAGATRYTMAPGPSLILGRFPAGNLAVVCAGDSIADGSGDGARPVTGPGFFARAGLGADGLDAIPSLQLTKFGMNAGTTAAGLGTPGAPGFAYRQALFRFGNVLVDQLGANTLGTSATVKAERVIDTSRAIWTLARSVGVQRIVRTTLLPLTTSTNRFVDAAGQTPRINWATGESRDQINAAFAAAGMTGEIDGLADLLGTIADPGDDHRWASTGAPAYGTRDGAHPSSAAHRLMAAALRARYLDLTVD